MKKLLVFIFIVSAVSIKAYTPTAEDRQIINYTFNDDFELAKKMIQEQMNLYPDSPKYYYYSINLKVLEYYSRIMALDPDKRDEGRKAINKELIDYCEKVIDKFDVSNMNVENKFYMGSIYGYLARLNGLDRSWWSAMRTGIKAENIMKDVLKADPKFYDANLVLGMMNYYADRLSGIISFIAGILGYSGDRDKGLAQLKSTFDNGTLTFGQTALTLIEVYANLEDNDNKALYYYEKFLNRFPRNKRILNGYFQKLISTGDFKKAETLLSKDDNNLLDDYSLAIYYDETGNSEKCLGYAEKAIADKKLLWHGRLNRIYYLAAIHSWLIGDKNKTAKYEAELTDDYKKSFRYTQEHENEFRWLMDLNSKICAGITTDKLEQMIAAKPVFDKSGGYGDVLNITIGKYYFQKNSLDKAELWFNKSLNAENPGNRYTALKYLTDIYMQQSTDKSKVEKLLSAIDDFDNDRLSYRAQDLEKKYDL